MMRKRAIGAYLMTLAAAGGLIVLPLPRQGNAEAAGTDTSRHFELFNDVLGKVRANYVVKPDKSKLVEDALKGVLAQLDQTRGGLSAHAEPGEALSVRRCAQADTRELRGEVR